MKRIVYLNRPHITGECIKLAVAASFYAADEEKPVDKKIFRCGSEIYVLKTATECEDIIDTPNYVYIFRGNAEEMAIARQKVVNSNMKILIEEYIDDRIFPQNVNDYEHKEKWESTQQKYDGSLGKLQTPQLHSGPLEKRGWGIGIVLIALCLTALLTWWTKGTIETIKTDTVNESSRWLTEDEIQTLMTDLLMTPSVGTLYEKQKFEDMASVIANYLLATDFGMTDCDLTFQIGCKELEESAAGHFHPGERLVCVKSMDYSGERMFYIITHETYHAFQYELVHSIQERINDGEITLVDVTNPIIKAWMEDFASYKSIDEFGSAVNRSQQLEKSAYHYSESKLAYYTKILLNR